MAKTADRGYGNDTPAKDPWWLTEHASCVWEQVGIRVWCRVHNRPLYLGLLPRHRQPDPCQDHPWDDWVVGLYRRCPVCFEVEWSDRT